MKRSKIFVESSHFLNFAPGVSPRDKLFNLQKKIKTTNYSKAHLLYMLSSEYEEMFICFVQFWSRRPVSLGWVQGTEFHFYAAFKSS